MKNKEVCINVERGRELEKVNKAEKTIDRSTSRVKAERFVLFLFLERPRKTPVDQR